MVRKKKIKDSDNKINKTIYFIAPQRPNEIMLFLQTLSTDDLVNALFYMPGSPIYRENIVKEANNIGIDIEKKVIPYSTVNAKIDDIIYVKSSEFAETYINILRSCSKQLLGDRDYFIKEQNLRAASVGLLDRFVSQLKCFEQFRDDFPTLSQHNVFYVPKLGRSVFGYQFLFESYNCKSFNIYIKHLTENQIHIVSSKLEAQDLFFRKQFHDLPTFDFKEIKYKIKSPYIVISSNLSDKMYKYTFLPIVKKLLGTHNCLVLCNYDSKDPNEKKFGYVDEFDLQNDIDNKNLYVAHKTVLPNKKKPKTISEEHYNLIRTSLRRFYIVSQKSADNHFRIYGYILAQYLSICIYPILRNLKHTCEEAEELASHWKSTAVMPGRHIEANIITAIAQNKKLSSYEVQAGTISPTKRFIKPLSEFILCIDKFSYKIYTEYYDKVKSKVSIIGGIKMDYDMRNIRNITTKEARSKIPLLKDYNDKKIFMLATQPIGAQKMGEVVRVAVQAAKSNKNILLMIKLHPNEHPDYEREYNRIISEEGLKKFVILKNEIDSRTAALASDIVSTYFSTVGLEALALGKETICINPFQIRPPFDMKSMGFVKEASNSKQLNKEIHNCLKKKRGKNKKIKDDLSILRDGKSLDRAIESINNNIKKHKRGLIDIVFSKIKFLWR